MSTHLEKLVQAALQKKIKEREKEEEKERQQKLELVPPSTFNHAKFIFGLCLFFIVLVFGYGLANSVVGFVVFVVVH